MKTLTAPSSGGGGGSVTINNNPSGNADLGSGLAALLGALGSYNQSQTIKDLADRARSDRLPYLNASLGYLNDPASYAAGPGKAAMDATLRGLSVNGNPIGEGTSLALANDSALRNWQSAVTGFGNMGLGGQDLQANLGLKASDADANILNAIGAGARDILAPKQDLASLLNQLGSLPDATRKALGLIT
jgi:hypothetical protein